MTEGGEWSEDATAAPSPTHSCFTAPSRDAVDPLHRMGVDVVRTVSEGDWKG